MQIKTGTDNTGWDLEDNQARYELQLFVAGTSSLSVRAITNLKSILTLHLEGQYNLEIVDVHQQPAIALNENVTAVPMLIKKNPSPRRKLIGDMSDTEKVLKGLGLK